MQRHRVAAATSAMAVSSFILSHKQTAGGHRNIDQQRDFGALSSLKCNLQHITVRLGVARRFADLFSRSLFVYTDYQLHDTWHKLRILLESKDLTQLPEHDLQGKHPWVIMSPHLENVHQRAAQSFYEACSTHGGVLVKLGQFISINMIGFIPDVYIHALTPLQDSCAPMSFDIVKHILMSEIWVIKYGPDVKMNFPSDRRQAEELLKSVFKYIEEKPLGSASLAQVHKAILDDGTTVAVKVQRPNLDMTTETDLFVLTLVSRAMEFCCPGAGFDWLMYVSLLHIGCPFKFMDFS